MPQCRASWASPPDPRGSCRRERPVITATYYTHHPHHLGLGPIHGNLTAPTTHTIQYPSHHLGLGPRTSPPIHATICTRLPCTTAAVSGLKTSRETQHPDNSSGYFCHIQTIDTHTECPLKYLTFWCHEASIIFV